MPLNFPATPQNNDVYTYGSRSWVYNGRSWIASGQIIGYTGSRGYAGSIGAVGYVGSAGAAGAIGYSGSVGPVFVNLLTSGALYVFDGTKRWYAPFNLSITSIKPRLALAADRDVIFIIKKNGISTVTLTITSGQTSAAAYTTPISLAEGDYLTTSITQVGTASFPGNDLYVQLKYSPT